MRQFSHIVVYFVYVHVQYASNSTSLHSFGIKSVEPGQSRLRSA